MGAFGGHGALILAVGWAEAAIGLVLLVLRLYGLAIGVGRLRPDLVFSILAIVVALFSNVLLNVAVFSGAGNHVYNLQAYDFVAIVKWTFAYTPVALTASTLAKFAIIALLLQIQGPTAKKRKYFLWFIGALLAIVTIIAVVLLMTACTPMSRIWHIFATSTGTCDGTERSRKFNLFQGAVAAISSIVLALWPISIAWNLQTSLRVKIAFSSLMALSILPISAILYRTVVLNKLKYLPDQTYNLGPVLLWFNTEQWVIIIISAIPPLRPLFMRIFSIKSSRRGSSHPRTGLTSQGQSLHRGSHIIEKSAAAKLGIQRVTTVVTESVPIEADEEVLKGHDSSV